MAAFDVQNDSFGLRSAVPQETLDRIAQQAAEQHDAQVTAIACAVIVLGAMVLVGLFYLIRHRRLIGRKADSAIVAGLASGVHISRAASAKGTSFAARVMAKANEKSNH